MAPIFFIGLHGHESESTRQDAPVDADVVGFDACQTDIQGPMVSLTALADVQNHCTAEINAAGLTTEFAVHLPTCLLYPAGKLGFCRTSFSRQLPSLLHDETSV